MRFSTSLLLVALAGALSLPVAAGESGRTTRDKMGPIVIPKMSFEEATLKDVFAYLRQKSKDLDIQGDGINIMFRCKKESLEQVVTMDFENIPLEAAIRYICMGTGMNYRVEPYAIVIADGMMELDRMETRTFPIDAGIFRTGHSKKAGDFNKE